MLFPAGSVTLSENAAVFGFGRRERARPGKRRLHTVNNKTQDLRGQTSESIILGTILTLAGGFMDAYSYLCRGKVFANAQTGNMLLLGVNLFERNWAKALTYALPVAAFTVGIVLAEVIRHSTQSSERLFHWRQNVLLAEIFCLAAVCYIPAEWNLLANSLTSLACGMQVETFRKIHGHGIATTMCIGNLRSGTESLCDYFRLREQPALRRALLYYSVILFFVAGAVLGNYFVGLIGQRSMLVCAGLLLIAFFIMFIDRLEGRFRAF